MDTFALVLGCVIGTHEQSNQDQKWSIGIAQALCLSADHISPDLGLLGVSRKVVL